MRWLILAAMLWACDAGTPVPKPTPQPAPTPVVAPVPPPIPWDGPDAYQPPLTDDERDVIVADLERWQADPKAIVDGGLAGTQHYVLVEPGTVKVALPAPWISVTYRDAGAEADRSNAPVGIMWIAYISVTGDTARLTLGGYSLLTAADRNKPRSCCCHQIDELVRKHGHWKYKATTNSICA